MIKLYVFYLIFGFYMLFESYFIWYFRGFNDGNAVITYLSLLSSTILCCVIPGLLLYHPKKGLILGIVALAGVFPFGIRWLIYRCTMESPIIYGAQNQIVLLATILFALGLLYSIKKIITYKNPHNNIILKRWLKIFLAFFPASLVLIFVILTLIDP